MFTTILFLLAGSLIISAIFPKPRKYYSGLKIVRKTKDLFTAFLNKERELIKKEAPREEAPRNEEVNKDILQKMFSADQETMKFFHKLKPSQSKEKNPELYSVSELAFAIMETTARKVVILENVLAGKIPLNNAIKKCYSNHKKWQEYYTALLKNRQKQDNGASATSRSSCEEDGKQHKNSVPNFQSYPKKPEEKIDYQKLLQENPMFKGLHIEKAVAELMLKTSETALIAQENIEEAYKRMINPERREKDIYIANYVEDINNIAEKMEQAEEKKKKALMMNEENSRKFLRLLATKKRLYENALIGDFSEVGETAKKIPLITVLENQGKKNGKHSAHTQVAKVLVN